MYISTDAIILKNTHYKESSIISRIFTYEHGKIATIFKGAKKSKNNLSGIIEPGNVINITYYNNNSNLKIAKEVNLKKNYHNTRKILDNYYYTMAIISLLDKLCKENNPEKILFKFLIKIFDNINEHKLNIDILFLYFLVQLNKFLGFELVENQSSSHGNELNDILQKLNKSEIIISEINDNIINKIKIIIYQHMKKHLIDLNDIYAIQMIKYMNHGSTSRSN